MEYSTSKRKYSRVKVSIPVGFAVLIPEDTFSPRQGNGVVSDLSERGAMVVTQLGDMPEGVFLQKVRYCSIEFNTILELPARIIGRAVWIQPVKEAGMSTYFRIGVFFEDCPLEITEKLHHYVAKILEERESEQL
jgi:hypothetical protein